jgi:hypothetical protein
VQVEWPPDDDAEDGDPAPWYDGMVKQFDEEQGYLIIYDDGEEQWEEMETDGSNFRFIEQVVAATAIQSMARGYLVRVPGDP